MKRPKPNKNRPQLWVGIFSNEPYLLYPSGRIYIYFERMDRWRRICKISLEKNAYFVGNL